MIRYGVYRVIVQSVFDMGKPISTKNEKVNFEKILKFLVRYIDKLRKLPASNISDMTFGVWYNLKKIVIELD